MRKCQRRFTFESHEPRRVLSAVSIPTDLTAEPSGEVVVPVEITNSTDVRGVEIEITYDTEFLDASEDSVTVGSDWSAGTADVVVSVDDAAGTIVAWVSAAEGLDSDSGNLLEIEFTVSSDAVVGDTAAIDLTEVVINEGEITVDPGPQTGEDSTDGLITFVTPAETDDDTDDDTNSPGPDSLSGYVYVDSNDDGICDDDECGVPGVQITLTGIDSSGNEVTRNVFTQGDGSYLFAELAPGTYQLTERQPAAMSDGQDSTTVSEAVLTDDNIANIVLESGEFYTENNFGEAGLYAEFISIRIFFASSPSPQECLLDTIVLVEEMAGNSEFAEMIRASEISFDSESSAPVAVADAYSTTEDTTLTVSVESGVLANDVDEDGDLLTATLVTSPSYGSLTINEDGSFTYTPDSGFTGTDTFTYQAGDGETLSETATVTITVSSDNTAPVAATDSYSVDEGETLTVSASCGVLANDSDDDGDSLTAALVASPSDGSLTLNDDGSFTYTPDSGFAGTDSFTYQASDGETLSNTATVIITVSSVNVAPDAISDSYSVDEDGTLAISASSGVLANDSDDDGDSLTATLESEPTNGTLSFDSDGSFTYTPDDDFNGTDTFTYTASDGSDESSEVTVTITVEAVNDVPVGTSDSYEAAADATLTVDTASGVLANDGDIEGDSLTAIVYSAPGSGALTLNSDGSFSYVPDSDFSGTDSFSYVASDGEDVSEAIAVSIHVNSPPETAADSYDVDEDSVLAVDAVLGLLANDSDGDGDTLSVYLTDSPSHGSLSLNEDGSFTYTPEADYDGTDSFTYIATDGTNESEATTVSISVAGIDSLENNSPDLADIANAQATPGVELEITVTATDSDGDNLTFALDRDDPDAAVPEEATITQVDNGSAVIRWTPSSSDASEDYVFSVLVVDDGAPALSDCEKFTVSVSEANVAPEAVADSYSVTAGSQLETDSTTGVLANDTDEDGDVLSATLLTGPSHGALQLSADGSFTYTPDSDYAGTDLFTYEASDGLLLSGSTTVSLTIHNTNEIPEAHADGYWVETSGTLISTAAIGVIANDSDADGDTLTASLVSMPAHGSVTLQSDGSFTYTPTTDFVGVDSFAYELSDRTESAQTDVTIQVGTDFGPVVISEFMAGGNETYADSEGEYYDWIEIHNLSDDDVNLAGWSLTDDESDLGKWVFPSVTVEAGGYLVVFASGNDLTDPTADLHTNFKLTSDGEYLAICTSLGEVTAEFAPGYPALQDGMSYGFDATATAQHFAEPTPGEPNTTNVLESNSVEGLVITEINYNPSAPTESELAVNASFDEDDFEFVELANVGDAAIDLTDLFFGSGIGFDFSESSVTSLSAGETLLLVSNQEAFEARYGTDYTIAGEFSGKLSNGGEQLTIFNAVSETAVDCCYDDEGDWPIEADGAGYTLELVALGDLDDPNSWDIGDLGGSPGTVPNWDSLVATALEDESV